MPCENLHFFRGFSVTVLVFDVYFQRKHGREIQMSITAAEIEKVILMEDDFGHEMRVGSILKPENIKYPQHLFFRSRFSNPSHGETYTDPVTGKARQYDFRTQISHGQYRERNISLAIECKNLNPELPLVICGRERTEKESYHLCISTDGEKSQLMKVRGANSLYKPGTFVGKSILRLRSKDKKLCSEGDSEIYDRYSQALASSRDLILAAFQKRAEPSYSFILPLVVVPDDSLWIAEYDDNGKPNEPKKINCCDYFVAYKTNVGIAFVLTHVRFVTMTGLSDLLATFANSDFHVWDEIFSRAAIVIAPDPT